MPPDDAMPTAMDEHEADTPPPERPRLPVRVIVAQAVLVAALAVWLLAVQRGIGWGDEWSWPVFGAVYPLSFLVAPLATLLGFGGLIVHLWRSLRREQIASHRRGLAWGVVVGLCAGAWCLQAALWSVTPGSVSQLAAIQLSDVSTGYLSEAWRIDDLGEYLREYAREMPRKPEHVATHPPGAVLFFYAVRELAQAVPALERAALIAGSTGVGLSIPELAEEVARYPTAGWQGDRGLATAMLASWILGAAGALMPLVVFAALRGQLGDERALAGAALLALMPGMLLFFPVLDQVVALLSALMLAALAATQRHWAWAAVAGVICAAALFVSLGALALVALGGVFLLLRAARQVGQSADASWSESYSVFAPLLIFGAGLLVGVGAWYLIGVDAAGVLSEGLGAHSSLTGRASSRSYHVWVWLNLVEFAIFLGLPLAALVVASVPRMVRALRETSSQALPAYLGASALIVLLLLDLSGTVKAETGRIWMFFGPWLAAAAAPEALDEDARDLRPLIIACALTALQLVLMAWTMQPIMRPY